MAGILVGKDVDIQQRTASAQGAASFIGKILEHGIPYNFSPDGDSRRMTPTEIFQYGLDLVNLCENYVKTGEVMLDKSSILS